MATNDRNDPFRGFNFVVEMDNTPIAGFSEVGGLSAHGDPTEYREGNDPENHVRKLVGLRKYDNLSFKRGYVQDDTLWRWFTNIANGVDDRRNGSITLMNEAHEPVIRWNFENAWINKIDGPGLNATGNEVAIESMELCHEKLTMELEP
ncbi:MAG: phage tail protein [Pseudomonadota bacterium]